MAEQKEKKEEKELLWTYEELLIPEKRWLRWVEENALIPEKEIDHVDIREGNSLFIRRRRGREQEK